VLAALDDADESQAGGFKNGLDAAAAITDNTPLLPEHQS
jgi:hypothetical protein